MPLRLLPLWLRMRRYYLYIAWKIPPFEFNAMVMTDPLLPLFSNFLST